MNLSHKIEDPIFRTLGRVADELGVEAYLIGGYVRDLFLHRTSKDIDVVCVGSGIAFAEAFYQAIGRKGAFATFKNFGTAQIKFKQYEVEFVGARRESYQRNSRKPIVEDGTLEDDQLRRDFTINALAISLNGDRFGELIDPFGGLSDMDSLIIRTPTDPDITFSDDPLRMLRAIRFSAQLGFDIFPATFDAIQRNVDRLEIISQERVADELNKIMLSPRPSVGWILLLQSGLLSIILPELVKLKGVETKEGKGHKDNFYHTMTVLDNVAALSGDLWLRWAALFHDIGKPITKRYDAKLGWTFYNHNFMGMKMLPTIFRRIKLPMNDRLKYVQKMVDLHMRPIHLVEEEVTDSAVRRLLFEAGDDIDALMTLCEADITSKNPEKVRRFLDNFRIVRRKLVEIEEKDRVRNFQPPVSGDEIMRWYNLTPCNTIGKIKSRIKEAILDGVIPNEREPALELMKTVASEYGLVPAMEIA